MRNVKYRTLVKPDTFIGRYMDYMSGLETPSAYDFWTAVWLTSLALGRGTVVLRPRIPVHMNWYIILCAESGLTRKSTAVSKATHVAHKFLEKVDDIILIEDKTTPETLEAVLNVASNTRGHAQAAITISELVRFLGRERYNMSMPGLLTDLYDCPDQRRSPGTLSRGPSVITNVFVSFLSASTPSWISKSVNPNVVEGGFTSRVIFVHAERRKHSVAWPSENEGDAEVATPSGLAHMMQRMRASADWVKNSTSHGGINLSESALKWYKRWYNSRPEHRDPFRATFEAREDEHVLRLAGVLAANDEGWLIEMRHLQAATKVILEAKTRGSRIFEGVMHADSLVYGIDKVRDVLIQAGTNTLTQTQIYNKVRRHFDRASFHVTLDILHELKMVQKFQTTSPKGGPRTALWRGTNLLTKQGAMELILEQLTPSGTVS